MCPTLASYTSAVPVLPATVTEYPPNTDAEVYDASVGHMVNYAWYASYAPANDPKYVVVVMIEKGGHGGAVAAPATRLIYDQLFHLTSNKSSGAVRSD